MQGLLRKETDPSATGHRSLIACKNQRLTSSDVSFLFMYRCHIAPVHSTLSMTTWIPTLPRTSNAGRHAGQGSLGTPDPPSAALRQAPNKPAWVGALRSVGRGTIEYIGYSECLAASPAPCNRRKSGGSPSWLASPWRARWPPSICTSRRKEYHSTLTI